MKIRKGFEEKDRKIVAELYAIAFKRKFVNLLGDVDTVSKLLSDGLNSDYCLACYKEDELVGIAGFHVASDALLNISISDFIKQFGFFKGLFKALTSGIVFYRKSTPDDELLMDGIAVREGFRGQGIGTLLFDELFLWAKTNGYSYIHLDVIDENPKAKALYERLGFKETSYEKVPGFIEKLIGVSGFTHMRKEL